MSVERFEPVVLVPLPAEGAKSIARVSGRLIATSLREMRNRGLEQVYYAHIPSELHAVLRSVVPSEWVPVDVAVAHYQCMSTLIPDPATQREIGRSVSQRRRNSYLLRFRATAIRTSGVSPLTILRRTPAVWSRIFEGGGARVVQTEPERVHLTICAEPLGEISYFRSAVTGVTEAAIGLMAPNVEVSQEPGSSGAPGEFELDVTWRSK